MYKSHYGVFYELYANAGNREILFHSEGLVLLESSQSAHEAWD